MFFFFDIRDFLDEQALMDKHLLRVHCKDLANMILQNQADFYKIHVDKLDTPADRSKVLAQLPTEDSKAFQKLFDSLSKVSKNFLLSLFSNTYDFRVLKIF